VHCGAGSDIEVACHLYTWGDKVEVLSPKSLAQLVHPPSRGPGSEAVTCARRPAFLSLVGLGRAVLL
jgi:hypothetical protein